MRPFVLLAAGTLSLVAVLTLLMLPPAALPATPVWFPRAAPVVRGAYHVHSVKSDGTGTLEEISAAAARAGLQFVIVTDHGDGTRTPEPPAYRSGVLCLDGVEISTSDGHYVALGLPQAPYPLAGSAADVIEDVRRLGGFGIAAHPGSPKPSLAWRDWNADFDAVEWLNADSEWRDEFLESLGRVLLTYAFRPVETLGSVLDRPSSVLQHWDRLTRLRRVPGLAGADAHARLGFRQGVDPYEDRVLARVPGYEVSFRAFTNHVVLDAPLTGNAERDAVLLLEALREGRVMTSIDSLARFAALDVRASSGGRAARPGEYLDVAAPVAIEAQIAAPPGTRLAVLRDGEVQYETHEPALRVDVGTTPGAYRVEAYLPDSPARSPIPWVLTNPIYVGLRDVHAAAAAPQPPRATQRTPIATPAWQAESSARSTSELQVVPLPDGTPALQWRFAIAAGPDASPYAAMLFPVDGGLGHHDRLQLRVQSDRPRRIWAQLRAPGPNGGARWGKSFYVDETLRSVELHFDAFTRLDAPSSERPPVDRVNALLLVIDTVNTHPGAAGTLSITDLWLAR